MSDYRQFQENLAIFRALISERDALFDAHRQIVRDTYRTAEESRALLARVDARLSVLRERIGRGTL